MSKRSTMWMIALVLVLGGCRTTRVAEVHHPATLVETGQDGIMKVVLEEQALARLGLVTAPVAEETVDGQKRLVVPYGALLYDTKGDTWAFTNPEPRAFVRHKVAVHSVSGNQVVLREGPAAGTLVVIVGAPELLGAEHKYGH